MAVAELEIIAPIRNARFYATDIYALLELPSES